MLEKKLKKILCYYKFKITCDSCNKKQTFSQLFRTKEEAILQIEEEYDYKFFKILDTNISICSDCFNLFPIEEISLDEILFFTEEKLIKEKTIEKEQLIKTLKEYLKEHSDDIIYYEDGRISV